MRKFQILTILVAFVFITSCGDESNPVPFPTSDDGTGGDTKSQKCNVTTDSCDLSIKGTYNDLFNTTHAISTFSWVSTHSTFGSSTYNIITVDNTEKRIIAQNSSTNGYAPSKFSAFDWTLVGSQLFYCQTAYDKDTVTLAESTPKADASNPSAGGCGGFPWSSLN